MTNKATRCEARDQYGHRCAKGARHVGGKLDTERQHAAFGHVWHA